MRLWPRWKEQGRKVFESVPEGYDQVAATLGAADTLFQGSAEQMGKLTEATLDYSRVAGGEAASNMENLGKVSNIFGDDAETAASSLDVLTKVGQDYAIGGGDLLQILQKQGPALSSLGLNSNEAAIAIGKMNAAGINVRKLGSAFDTFIPKAVKAGEDPVKALEDLTAKINAAETDQEKLALATEAMGPAGISYVNALKQGIDITGDFSDEIAAAEGTLAKTADESATFGEKMAELQNKVGGALADVALQLFDTLVPVLTILTDTLLPALEPLLTVVGDVLTGLAPIIQLVGQTMADVLQPVMEALSPIVETLSGILLTALTPILEGLAPILTALLVPALTLVSGLLAAFEPLIPPITKVITTVMGVLGRLAGILSNIMTSAIETLMPVLEELYEQLGPVIMEILDILLPMLGDLMDAIGPAIMEVVGALLPVLADLMRQLGPVIVEVLQALMPLLRTLTDVIMKIVTTGLDILLPPVTKLIELLGKGTSKALGYVVKIVIMPILRLLIGVLEKVTEAVGWVVDKVKDVIGWFQKMWDKLNALDFGAIWDTIKDTFASMVNAIINVWNRLDFSVGPYEIPSWIPLVGGKKFHIADVFPDIPTIALAEGGIVTDPTTALIGEAGPEAVIPLSEPNAADMLGGNSLVVNVSVTGGGDPQAIKRAVIQGLNEVAKGNSSVLSPFLRMIARTT